jgi:hypothetical protein
MEAAAAGDYCIFIIAEYTAKTNIVYGIFAIFPAGPALFESNFDTP